MISQPAARFTTSIAPKTVRDQGRADGFLRSARRLLSDLPLSLTAAPLLLTLACTSSDATDAATTGISESPPAPASASAAHSVEPTANPAKSKDQEAPTVEQLGATPDRDGDSAGASDSQEAEAASDRQPPQDAPRVYAKTRNVWVRGKPTSKTQWIGFLWFGNSVKLRSTEPVAGPGCKRGWYAVEPRGYVCVDGERATLDAQDPVLQGIFPVSPDPNSPNPHPFYGETAGSQVYRDLPTVKQQRAREWDYRFRMGYIEKALGGGDVHDSLIGFDYQPAPQRSLLLPELPRTLRMGRRRYIPDSTVAWSREVEHEGRSFLLTDDLTWVPKDRVKPYEPVSFSGLHLGKPGEDGRTPELPLAFFRNEVNPRFLRGPDGDFVKSGDSYERLSWVGLTGEAVTTNGEDGKDRTFHKTRHGDWIDGAQSVVPELREKTPWGARTDGSPYDGESPRGRQTWIDVSVLGGWLLAYEGIRPVFVTLMSPGRGGVPARGAKPLATSATPTGRYKITGKFVTATMVAPNDLVHSAVPWAQNFSGPYALHGAYWHNDWGNKKSGGCVNVSPEDGKWLFDFTEPVIPDGWHGVRWLPKKEAATTFITRR